MGATKARDILKALKNDGWTLDRTQGSHHQFKHPTKSGVVTVAYRQVGDTIPAGTVNNIWKVAGLK